MFPLFRSIEKAWVDLDSFSLVTEYDTLLLIVKDFFRDIPMSKLTRIFRVSTPVLAIIFVAGVLFSFPTEKTVEGKILRHIRQNLSSGQKLLITNLYEKVFTKPEERKVLDKLYRAFFRIPLFLLDYKERLNRYPTLEEVASQFALEGPASAEVLLSVMEADPRVPDFIERDTDSREIINIDAEKVRADRRFSSSLKRRLAGWEGQAATLDLKKLNGDRIELADFGGYPFLLYVWFTGCPPCMATTPELVKLHDKFNKKGFTVVAANADRYLQLGFEDEVIHRYSRKQKINFPIVRWNAVMDRNYGGIAIFPTMFLVDKNGTIIQHYVGYQELDRLESDVKSLTG